MASRTFSSITDQVTERLRQGILEGHWRGALPGRKRLAEELGCSQWTIVEATQRLAKQGFLVSPGPGFRQRIVLPGTAVKPRALRLMILLYEKSDRSEDFVLEMVRQLRENGHQASMAEKTMHDLGMDVKRVARFVEGTEADAWVVAAGSRDVLEWFSGREVPTFALFGRSIEVPLASTAPKKAEALRELVDRLVESGHRRIVMLAREERRKPTPGFLERLFLDRLGEHGIPTGPYNLPDWGDSPAEFHRALHSLFQHTPPTALIISQPSLCIGTLQHFSQLGISAPADVSLACMDFTPYFEWCEPGITHIRSDFRPIIRRVLRWADNVSRGKEDRRKSSHKVRLVVGGTIGPVSTAGI